MPAPASVLAFEQPLALCGAGAQLLPTPPIVNPARAIHPAHLSPIPPCSRSQARLPTLTRLAQASEPGLWCPRSVRPKRAAVRCHLLGMGSAGKHARPPKQSHVLTRSQVISRKSNAVGHALDWGDTFLFPLNEPLDDRRVLVGKREATPWQAARWRTRHGCTSRFMSHRRRKGATLPRQSRAEASVTYVVI